jgi:hypothetical protein
MSSDFSNELWVSNDPNLPSLLSGRGYLDPIKPDTRSVQFKSINGAAYHLPKGRTLSSLREYLLGLLLFAIYQGLFNRARLSERNW